MPSKTRKAARSRAPLSRERVLRAAMALADESGLESLSMRKLAQALGVEAMSLYRHVASRDDILDGLVDLAISEIEIPAKGANWKTAMRQRARSARDVLSRHLWAAGLFESRRRMSPETLRYADAIIGSLRDAGFSTAMAYRAFFTLDSFIYGFIVQVSSWGIDPKDAPQETARLRPQVSPEMFPNIVAVMEHVMSSKPSPGMSAEFEFGLDLLLDGLERLRDVKGNKRSAKSSK
jgi:AcrR family transcriptional regulator